MAPRAMPNIINSTAAFPADITKISQVLRQIVRQGKIDVAHH